MVSTRDLYSETSLRTWNKRSACDMHLPPRSQQPPPAAATAEAVYVDSSSVPVVDMEAPDAKEVVARACKESGFFFLKNHGVSKSLIRDTFKQFNKFFDLPRQAKMDVGYDTLTQLGYVDHEQRLDVSFQTKNDTKQTLDLHLTDTKKTRGVIRTGDDELHEYEGTRYPSSDLLSSEFHDTILAYHTNLAHLSDRLLLLLTEAMGLDVNNVNENLQCLVNDDLNGYLLRAASYDPEPSDVASGVLGCGAHTDWGLVTILSVDNEPGLEIYNEERDQWMRIPYEPDTFIVNLGDMSRILTNGVFKSGKHRVVIRSSKKRTSIPFFTNPDAELIIRPLDKFCGEENPPKYGSKRAGDWIEEKTRTTHPNRATA